VNWQVVLSEKRLTDASGKTQFFPEKSYVVPIKLSIVHGPVMLGKTGVHFGLGYAAGDLQIPASYRETFAQYVKPDSTYPEVRLALLVTFLNHADVIVRIPAFHLRNERWSILYGI
jgi:hypothetical protein